MKKHPEITTIIPTYRRPRLLRRAIRSVLQQTYPHFRVCVYDNASGDATSEIAAEFMNADSRVYYRCHPRNIGSIANFNYGMSRVETDYFSLLSDDDILLPDFYETALEGFGMYPDAMFSAGEVIEFNEERDFVRARLSLWPRAGLYEPPHGLAEMFGKEPVWTGILFRKDVIHNVGLLDPEVGNSSDLDLELRIASAYPFCISQKPCAILVDHGSSVSTNTKMGTYWVGWHRMMNKLLQNEQIPLAVRRRGEQQLKKQLVGFMFRTRALIRGDFEDALQTAEVLRTVLKQRTKAIMLLVMTTIMKYFPPVFAANAVLRRKLRSMRSRSLARKLPYRLEDYYRFLDD